MDLNGFGINETQTQKTLRKINHAMAELGQGAEILAGKKFSLRKTGEVHDVIKDKVFNGSWPPDEPRINEEFLARLGKTYPLVAKIRDWRKLQRIVTKLRSVKGFCQGNDACRIEPRSGPWTSTGRVSLSAPNLQYMNTSFTICTKRSVNIAAREVFQPLKGAVLLSADYSQLELRILAHLSKDKNLGDVFQAGRDPFRKMARAWKGRDEGDVDDSLREQTKKICYGICYGLHASTLAKNLGVERGEAESIIQQFKNAYPGIGSYKEMLLKESRTRGFVTTILGRRRFLPGLRSKNETERAAAERQVLNSTVQGSAADLLRLALVMVDRELTKQFPELPCFIPEAWRKDGWKQEGAFVVLQMHDELLLEVSEQSVGIVSSLVRQQMEDAGKVAKMCVSLVVRLRKGHDWANLEQFQQNE
ncbi:DNA polymerase I, thermostable-like isoform X2 [Amblyomma americanum]